MNMIRCKHQVSAEELAFVRKHRNSGVYVYIDATGVEYIGFSGNLEVRLRTHFVNGRRGEHIPYFMPYGEAAGLERLVLQHFLPSGNSSRSVTAASSFKALREADPTTYSCTARRFLGLIALMDDACLINRRISSGRSPLARFSEFVTATEFEVLNRIYNAELEVEA